MRRPLPSMLRAAVLMLSAPVCSTCLSPRWQLRAFVAKHDAPHTYGCLFSGAGGGFLMVIADEGTVPEALKITINHEPVCQPYRSATLAEARTAPKCGPPPACPPWGVPSPWSLDIEGRPYASAPSAAAAAPGSHAMRCAKRVAIGAAIATAAVAGVAIGLRRTAK